MTFTVRDFGHYNNHRLIPEFFIRSRVFHELNDEIMLMRKKEPQDEHEEENVVKEFLNLVVVSLEIFTNIADNCLEDAKTFDSDLAGRFASIRNDLNSKELDDRDMLDVVKELLNVYDFSLAVMTIIEYCFIMGGKVWADKAITSINEHKKSELDIKEILSNPNIGVKAIMIDQNGKSIEVSRERILQLFEKDDVEDDPFDLINMKTIGEA